MDGGLGAEVSSIASPILGLTRSGVKRPAPGTALLLLPDRARTHGPRVEVPPVWGPGDGSCG